MKHLLLKKGMLGWVELVDNLVSGLVNKLEEDGNESEV